MNYKKIAAVPGRLVIDPDTGRKVTSEAIIVPDTPFWRRAIRSGDVAEVAPSKSKSKN